MAFSKINEIISDKKSFIITSHIMPDGDSIGSLLAMTTYLNKLGKTVFPIVNDTIPQRFSFLPGSKHIMRPHDVFCDVIISLDAGDEARLGFDKSISEYGAISINIDHHKTNDRFADINLVDPIASSTGEILYDMISTTHQWDMDMALCIYTAIITDTGSVKYSNTSAKTLRILSHLVELGVEPEFISREVFENKSIGFLKLLGLFLGTVEFYEEGKIALSHLTKGMLDESGARDEDAQELINWPRVVKGVEVAALLKELKPTVIKVGLRSNGKMDVSDIAVGFDGGGHSKAAGCSLNMSLNEAKVVILNSLREHLKRDSVGRDNKHFKATGDDIP